jgi:hypothetical protein
VCGGFADFGRTDRQHRPAASGTAITATRIFDFLNLAPKPTNDIEESFWKGSRTATSPLLLSFTASRNESRLDDSEVSK